ncbi:MAG: hypothetical protein JKX73_00880, partial [Flavobacteriales bacterium]|nr:hypothetical protein [Flavobacteriales bacterium]
MKKIYSTLVLSLAFLISVTQIVQAQQVEIEGIRKREFKGVKAIYDEVTQKVSGYYTFYVNERKGKQTEFVIAIFDDKMKMVKQTPITMTKRSKVDGSCFNGKNFLFVFNDMAKKSLSYVTVNQSGDIIKTKGIIEAKRYAATADVFPGDNGFFIVKPLKDKKWGYSIEKINAELKSEWEKRFMVEKGFLSVDMVKSGRGRVVLVQTHRLKMLSAKVEGSIVCLDDKTGDEIYRQSLFLTEKTLVPSTFELNEKKEVTCGGMYFDGLKYKKGNSDGIFFMRLAADGKQLVYTSEDWKEGIQKLLKKASKKSFSLAGKPKVLFHSITASPDGTYQIIGETFKKGMKIMPEALLGAQKVKDLVTGRYIGDISRHEARDHMAAFTIQDFVVFSYDKAGALVNLNVIEKPYTKITVYAPLSTVSGLRLAKMVKQYGFFDYAFTTKSPSTKEPY